MSEWDEELDENTPKWARALAKQNKELRKTNEKLLSQVTQLQSVNTGRSLSEELARIGANPQVAKFYPSDRPTDTTSVTEWWEENKDYFGSAKSDEPDLPDALNVQDLESLALMRDLKAAQAYERDFGVKLKEANSKEEIMAVMQEAASRIKS